MSVNLMDIMKQTLTSAAIDKIGGMVGLEPAKSKSALAKVIPAVIGGYVNEASTPAGLDRVAGALSVADDTIVDDIVGFLGGDSSQLFDIGGKIVQGLFGAKQHKVTDSLARATGTNASTIGSLLKIAAPLVTAFLARQKKSRSLDAGGLGELLRSQKPDIAAALPGDLAGELGLREARDAGAGLLKKVLPWIVIALVAFFAWKLFAKGDDPKPPPAPKTVLQTALQGVEAALTEAASIEDVKAAIPRIEAATASLEGLLARADSLTAEQRAYVGAAATALPARLEAWTAKAAEIPGAAELLRPVLVAFGRVVDKLAAWA